MENNKSLQELFEKANTRKADIAGGITAAGSFGVVMIVYLVYAKSLPVDWPKTHETQGLYLLASFFALLIVALVIGCLVELWVRKERLKLESPDHIQGILRYLDDQVLKPKDDLVHSTQWRIDSAQKQLDTLKADLQLLERVCQEADQDSSDMLIHSSRIDELNRVIPALEVRIGELNEQVKRSEEIVAPFKEQRQLINAHLHQSTQLERISRAYQLNIRLGRKVELNEIVLVRLAQVAEEVSGQLKDLRSESKALASAKIEVARDLPLPTEAGEEQSVGN